MKEDGREPSAHLSNSPSRMTMGNEAQIAAIGGPSRSIINQGGANQGKSNSQVGRGQAQMKVAQLHIQGQQ